MKLGIVSDIHGNATALRRAFDVLATADRLVCLGDAISSHRFSNEVVGLLRDGAVTTILGNHETLFLGLNGARARESGDVDPELLGWLASRPIQASEVFGSRSIWLVHGAPWQTEGYARLDDPRFAEALMSSNADALLCGHTHQPGMRRVGPKMLLNPGSVGEGRPTPLGRIGSCAMLDLDRWEAEIIDLDWTSFNR